MSRKVSNNRSVSTNRYDVLPYQIVENHRIGGKIQQRVIATLGRLEELQSSGQFDALLCSGARFAEAVMLLGAHQMVSFRR